MPKFSADESVSLEKKVDLSTKPVETKSEDLDSIYEISRCAEWIKQHNFSRVCLQFPDFLLPDSTEVVLNLQSILNQTVYLLGDTAYESCCIDYVAAEHINADAIIHFGPICFSKTSAKISYLNIYEKHKLNITLLKAAYRDTFSDADSEIVLLVDTPFIHCLADIGEALKTNENVEIQRIDELKDFKDKKVLFIGKHERKLINIEFSLKPKALYYFDGSKISNFKAESRVLKRRNFLIEKIKDSRTIGIVIGTLAVQNYLKIIDRMKKLVELNRKKYYLISVGKPTIAKLANFPEIDIYVIITCSMSEIYESRDFYKPIATPFDVEIALNSNRDSSIQFCYDYNSYLKETLDSESLQPTQILYTDISLLTNNIRCFNFEEKEAGASTSTGNKIAVKNAGTVALSENYGAGFLANRSWQGLEQNLGRDEPELAQEGKKGIPLKYDNEPKS